MNDKLKPCPFCGGKARESFASTYVKCGNVECESGSSVNCLWFPREAWNTRTDDKRIKELEDDVKMHFEARVTIAKRLNEALKQLDVVRGFIQAHDDWDESAVSTLKSIKIAVKQQALGDNDE